MAFHALKNSFNVHTDVETGFDSLINRSSQGVIFLSLFVANIKIKENTFFVIDRNLSEKKISPNSTPEIITLLNYELNIFVRIYRDAIRKFGKTWERGQMKARKR